MVGKYFSGSILFTLICVGIGAFLGWELAGTAGILSTVWIIIVLGVLEVSLSFDNAVVNATVLKDMDAKWRRRFLTWGILIAVFGMRIIFPLLIVAIAAHLGPIDAIRLAIAEPVHYQHIIEGAHIGIAGFGGAFLAMVGLKFFFDADKEVHWIGVIERQLTRLSSVPAVEIAILLVSLIVIAGFLPPVGTNSEGQTIYPAMTFVSAGVFGLLTFIGVEAIGELLGGEEDHTGTVVRSGLASFLYLEVLDASFSFDGVIGAFALSNNIIIIALGLGIGAMFVRSLTIMLVDKGTLSEYKYLEHGAFWAIIALAVIMLVSAIPHVEIPETVTGLIGAVLIGASFWWSVRHNRLHPDGDDDEEGSDPVLPDGSHGAGTSVAPGGTSV